MKHTKKLIVAVIAVVAAFALCVPALAFAADDTGTITVNNATYGKEYKAYKIFDATYSGDKISYKVDADHKGFVSTELFEISASADSSGMYSVWAKDGAPESDIIDWAKENYDKFDATGKIGTFDEKNAKVLFEDMPFGYYYITSTLGTAIAIDSSHPNADVKDKNASAPTVPTKTIISVDGVEASGVTANAHVGSVVGFKIEGNATNYTTTVDGDTVKYEENTAYAFEDTFTNMTIDESSFVVKVNGEAIEYTPTVSGGKIIVDIPLVDANGKHIYKAEKESTGKDAGYIPIEITYTATITAAAAGEPATNEVGKDKVEVYTYAFQVAKTDGADPLPGAQFELWYNGAALKFVDNGDGTYTYDATNGTVTALDMTTNTTIVVKGLDNAWAYTLKETVVPNGYNQAADIPVSGSSLTKVEEGVNTTPASTALYKETVINRAGSVLPSTGGMGTTILYIVGGIMIVVAAVFLVGRRRSSKNNDSDDQM